MNSSKETQEQDRVVIIVEYNNPYQKFTNFEFGPLIEGNYSIEVADTSAYGNESITISSPPNSKPEEADQYFYTNGLVAFRKVKI